MEIHACNTATINSNATKVQKIIPLIKIEMCYAECRIMGYKLPFAGVNQTARLLQTPQWQVLS
jgi:hypothetical protein